MGIQCPVCCSSRVAEGGIGSSENQCWFELPPQEKGFWRTLGPRVSLTGPAHLCLDCGAIWTQVDRHLAIEEFARRGNDELLNDLRISTRPKRKWMWRLFGTR